METVNCINKMLAENRKKKQFIMVKKRIFFFFFNLFILFCEFDFCSMVIIVVNGNEDEKANERAKQNEILWAIMYFGDMFCFGLSKEIT